MASSVTRKLMPANQSRPSAQRFVADLGGAGAPLSDKCLLYLFDDGPRRGARVLSLCDGPPDNQIVGSGLNCPGRGHDAGLIACVSACRSPAACAASSVAKL